MSTSPQKIPGRSHLLTEQRLKASQAIDTLETDAILRLINAQDCDVPHIVQQAIPAIGALVEDAVAALSRGGRLIYLGAGTSGRLGVLDASECPPTYFCDSDQVIGLIAGGDRALRQSIEDAEDQPQGPLQQLDQLRIGAHDLVIGIAAGGSTPWVWGGLSHAQTRNSKVALICCVPDPELLCPLDHLIVLPVGPEVVTGSTRMKAGTATKLVLNMITTATMIQLGKVWGNLMVDLRVSNAKLRDRAIRILMDQCDISAEQAEHLLKQSHGRVKIALVMSKRQCDATEAAALLQQQNGKLRNLIGAPRT